MKTIAYTWVKDYVAMARDMRASLHKWHPDLDLRVFTWAECEQIVRAEKVPPGQLFAALGQRLAKDHDLVIHIDADILVTGPLDRVLVGDFDVAGVRANPDQGVPPLYSQFTRLNRITGEYTSTSHELNAGFFAVRNAAFWEEWIRTNIRYAADVTMGEQDTFNDLCWAYRYECKVLDPPGVPEYWGTSTQWGKKYLESWGDLRVVGDTLRLRSFAGADKRVHMLHLAGEKWPGKELGFDAPLVRDRLTSEVRDFLVELRRP